MKKFSLKVIKFTAVCMALCALLVAGGYFYLRQSFKKTENTVSNEPYSFSPPENCGVLLSLDGDLTFLYLDFAGETLYVVIPPEGFDTYEKEIYGYGIDRTVRSDYSLLSVIVDYAGGIELEINGERLRCTGAQVTDMMSRTADTGEFKRTVITSLLNRVGENGIDEKVFSAVINMSTTDLAVPDCFRWENYIKRMCADGRIVN